MCFSNPAVRSFIQTHFIPAWESIRQAPRVTIDLGGGHRIERTLRGNIAALVMKPDGRVVDAWPGVYSPEAFLEALTESLAIWRQAKDVDSRHFDTTVLGAHRLASGTGGLVRLTRLTAPSASQQPETRWRFVTPLGRARLARAKFMVERPLEVLLDREAITSQAADPTASTEWLGARIITTGTQVESLSPLERDSIHHLSVKRPRVHAAFAGFEALPRRSALEHLLFDELGGIPMDDPWLGFGALRPPPHDEARPSLKLPAPDSKSDSAWFSSLNAGMARARVVNRPICLVRTIGKAADFPVLRNADIRRILADEFVTVVETIREAPTVHIEIDPDHQISRSLRVGMVSLILHPDGEVIDVIPGLGNAPRALAGALHLAIGQDAMASLEAFADRGEGLRWKIMTPAEKIGLAYGKRAVEMPLIKAIGDLAVIPAGAPESLKDVYHRWPEAKAILAELSTEGSGADLDQLTTRVFLEALGWDLSDPMLGLEDVLAYDDARLADVARGVLSP